jgi:uncharacterized protein DUF5752
MVVTRAQRPFRFVTASYITRIERQHALTVGELRDGLESCSDESIFHHTFQSLGQHHFLTEGFSNDFAQWALAGLNRPRLAEQLAGLDVRSYCALADLRIDLLRVVDDFCRTYPDDALRPAFEPFYFCASVEVTVPLGWEAWTLEEFRALLERCGHASFQFHFLVSRLRLHLETNDFSRWFVEELRLEALAQRANRIDIVTNTLDSAKATLTRFIDRELAV